MTFSGKQARAAMRTFMHPIVESIYKGTFSVESFGEAVQGFRAMLQERGHKVKDVALCGTKRRRRDEDESKFLLCGKDYI